MSLIVKKDEMNTTSAMHELSLDVTLSVPSIQQMMK